MDAFPSSDAFAAAIEDFENNKEALGFRMKWAASYELIRSYDKLQTYTSKKGEINLFWSAMVFITHEDAGL